MDDHCYHIAPAEIGPILERAFGQKDDLFVSTELLAAEVQEGAYLFENIFSEVADAIYAHHVGKPPESPILGPWTNITTALIHGLRCNCSTHLCLQGLKNARKQLKKSYESDEMALQHRSQIWKTIRGVLAAANSKHKSLIGSMDSALESSTSRHPAVSEQVIRRSTYSLSPVSASSTQQQVLRVSQPLVSIAMSEVQPTATLGLRSAANPSILRTTISPMELQQPSAARMDDRSDRSLTGPASAYLKMIKPATGALDGPKLLQQTVMTDVGLQGVGIPSPPGARSASAQEIGAPSESLPEQPRHMPTPKKPSWLAKIREQSGQSQARSMSSPSTTIVHPTPTSEHSIGTEDSFTDAMQYQPQTFHRETHANVDYRAALEPRLGVPRGQIGHVGHHSESPRKNYADAMQYQANIQTPGTKAYTDQAGAPGLDLQPPQSQPEPTAITPQPSLLPAIDFDQVGKQNGDSWYGDRVHLAAPADARSSPVTPLTMASYVGHSSNTPTQPQQDMQHENSISSNGFANTTCSPHRDAAAAVDASRNLAPFRGPSAQSGHKSKPQTKLQAELQQALLPKVLSQPIIVQHPTPPQGMSHQGTLQQQQTSPRDTPHRAVLQEETVKKMEVDAPPSPRKQTNTTPAPTAVRLGDVAPQSFDASSSPDHPSPSTATPAKAKNTPTKKGNVTPAVRLEGTARPASGPGSRGGAVKMVNGKLKYATTKEKEDSAETMRRASATNGVVKPKAKKGEGQRARLPVFRTARK